MSSEWGRKRSEWLQSIAKSEGLNRPHIVILEPCSTCGGVGDMMCAECKGQGYHQHRVALETFKKLLTED
jgi:hypothetical protein